MLRSYIRLPSRQGCARLIGLESNLTGFELKWVKTELIALEPYFFSWIGVDSPWKKNLCEWNQNRATLKNVHLSGTRIESALALGSDLSYNWIKLLWFGNGKRVAEANISRSTVYMVNDWSPNRSYCWKFHATTNACLVITLILSKHIMSGRGGRAHLYAFCHIWNSIIFD